MKTVLKGLLLSGVLFALTGCGVTGRWSLQSIKPETAAEHFHLKCMCLMDDGTFAACASVKGKMEQLSGTYTFDQKAEKLTFKEKDGKTYAYDAELAGCGSEMKVSSSEKGKEWTAVMKHEGACQKDQCCAGGKTCDPKQCGKACPAKKTECPQAEKKAEPKAGEAKKPAEPKKATEPAPKDKK